MRPTRNRLGLVASLVIALLAAVWSACTTDSQPPAPTASPTPTATASPPPDPTTLPPPTVTALPPPTATASPPPTATASPPPNPTTLSSITISDSELMLVEGESVAIVITLDSDPGQDIEVQVRLVRVPHRGLGGRDPVDVTLAPGSVTWTATDWEQPRTVEVAAVVDEVRERVEPHELQVWTYGGGKTGPDQHILAKETIQLTLADSRGLVALTGGSEGEVVLEWTPADQRTQRWQYRERPRSVYGHGERYIPDWSAWLDVPHSDATTQSLRVSGLAPSWIYVFQVRPWLRAGAGAASEQVDGPTATIGSDGIAIEEPGFCLERGRRFRFGPEVTFVVPHRMLLCTGQAGNTTASVVTLLYDETTRTWASFDPRTGEIVAETFWDAATNSYKLVYRPTGEIVRSWMELPPPPGYDLRALWDEIEQSIRREPLP